MKRIVTALFLITIVLSPGLFSLELELKGGLGNIAYDQKRTTALSDESVKGSFSPTLYPLILARLSGEYRGISYNAGFTRDPLLKNRLNANMRADFEYFFLETGPFVSLFGTKKLPVVPGITSRLGFMIPGIIFIDAEGASTLALPMYKKGYFYQNNGTVSAGFWVPYVICSLNMGIKNFAVREQENLLIENALNRYFFRADVFTKNVPYTIQVDLGYQNLKRSYITQIISGANIVNNTETDEFKSIFVSFEVSYEATANLKFLLGGEIPVYSWGNRPMKDPPKETMLFEARAGLVWTFGNP